MEQYIPEINSWYGLAALSIFVTVPSLFTLMLEKGKKGSDTKDKSVGEIDLDSAILRMIVKRDEERNKERAKDREHIATLQREMEQVQAVVKVKYPVALSHIRHLHARHPDPDRVIPREIADDLYDR